MISTPQIKLKVWIDLFLFKLLARLVTYYPELWWRVNRWDWTQWRWCCRCARYAGFMGGYVQCICRAGKAAFPIWTVRRPVGTGILKETSAPFNFSSETLQCRHLLYDMIEAEAGWYPYRMRGKLTSRTQNGYRFEASRCDSPPFYGTKSRLRHY